MYSTTVLNLTQKKKNKLMKKWNISNTLLEKINESGNIENFDRNMIIFKNGQIDSYSETPEDLIDCLVDGRLLEDITDIEKLFINGVDHKFEVITRVKFEPSTLKVRMEELVSGPVMTNSDFITVYNDMHETCRGFGSLRMVADSIHNDGNEDLDYVFIKGVPYEATVVKVIKLPFKNIEFEVFDTSFPPSNI